MARPLLHILLIDDSADDLAHLRQLLLQGGSPRYRFSEAQLGAEGVRKVLDPQHGPIDCVLLDYDLPDMNALEVLAAVRDGAGIPPCPVVVVTGSATEEGLSLLTAGAQDYIGKRWISPESLTRTVENAIERFALETDRARAEQAVRSSEERYRSLFNSIDAGYAVMEMMFDDHGVGVDSRYIEVNPAFKDHLGLNEVEGKTMSSLVPGIEAHWFETYGTVALTGVPVRIQRHSEALQAWYDVYAFRLGAPQAHQVAVLFTDITEQRRTEEALVAAKAEAEAASRAKSDFLLSMSHELRSPLSSMLRFTQLIEAGTPPPTPAQQDSVRQILHAGWYLLGLINEILDLTTIESGRVVLASQSTSLNQVLDECRAMVEPQAQRSGIRLAFPHLKEVCTVQADPIRTKQVLLNLLTNAIKYNRADGRIDVRCTATPGRPVRISVEDTGAGLSAAQQAQLFQPFNRLGQEAGAEEGTGIGLVISKRLVELMGGHIGVDSTVGVGSCFWFELDAVAVAPRDMAVHTLLCVDDDPVRLRRVEELVARWPDVCLLRARDVRDGIKIARSARPDVILMGVHVPDPDGVDTLMLLAKDPATAKIPVIPIVFDPLPRDVEVGLGSGFFGYDVQPVQSAELLQVLEQVIQPNHAGEPRATAKENT